MNIKNDGISWHETLMCIFMQKIKFILYLFLEMLLKYYKHVILGTLGMFGHPQKNQ